MPRKALVKLSDAETEILRLVWQLGSATVQDVCAMLPARRRIAYATVQTLLRRLEKKGYVGHERKGRAHVFSPAVRREAVIRKTVGEFVQRLFGGDPLPLMLHLAGGDKLDAEDIRRLRKIINRERS